MTYEDEILLEQHFSYKNMSIEERNFFINLIMHSKDVCDSEIFLTNHDTSSYDLLYLNFSNENGVVRFDGATCNEHTNKLIYGTIDRIGNKYSVKTNVYVCNDFIYDDDRKEYTVNDVFVFKNDKIIRRSCYQDGVIYEAEVEFLNDNEMEDYLQDKCNEMKLKR